MWKRRPIWWGRSLRWRPFPRYGSRREPGAHGHRPRAHVIGADPVRCLVGRRFRSSVDTTSSAHRLVAESRDIDEGPFTSADLGPAGSLRYVTFGPSLPSSATRGRTWLPLPFRETVYAGNILLGSRPLPRRRRPGQEPAPSPEHSSFGLRLSSSPRPSAQDWSTDPQDSDGRQCDPGWPALTSLT